ncbi:MAG: FtsX-like permease family protein [Candidatus Poseidoniaceae archaeon]
MARMKERLASLQDAPNALRLATQSAWRGRERGLAVVAGVFLASLVITTVLSYGVGLSQIFFQESLESEVYDAKVEFRRAPAEGASGWTNDTAELRSVCTELLDGFVEFEDCMVVLGRQGLHTTSFFSEEFAYAQPLEITSVVDDTNVNWTDDVFDYPELGDAGPPSSTVRAVRFIDDSGFDGVFADRIKDTVITGLGEWPNATTAVADRSVMLPASVASDARAEVGDVLESLTFAMVVDRNLAVEGGISESDCEGGDIKASENGMVYCRILVTVSNLTVAGVYEEAPLANPTIPANALVVHLDVLDEAQQKTLMDNDHVYLAVAIDRAALPTSSTADAAEWLDNVQRRVGQGNYTDAGISLVYIDIIGGTISFLNIFLGLIQTFDYIIMVPIVILSLSVLVYGLVLSLEQRRREISIHRVIGADADRLQRMVLVELGVMALVAWFAGYVLALAAVPGVLSAVGFMAFEPSGVSVNPVLGFASTLITALATIGLALLFGRSRSRRFLELEIEEGVRRTSEAAKPKTWLHALCFGVGGIGTLDTWVELQTGGDGLYSNFFLEGLLGIFGPFLLWIGGALLLGRLGALGPQLMQLLLGRTPLLKDVRRGLKGSGSSESVNRLAVIMLLTLSIVTLAAVQGYTGTLVDERTADAQVGGDLQVSFETPVNMTTALEVLRDIGGQDLEVSATTTPSLFLRTSEGDAYQTWVVMNGSDDVLRWSEQSLPGDDVGTGLDMLSNGTFSVGEDAAFSLDLWGSGRDGRSDRGDDLLGAGDDRSEVRRFTYEEVNITVNTDDAGGMPDLNVLLQAYRATLPLDLSYLDLSGSDLSERDFGVTDLSRTNLSGTDLTGANLSGALMIGTDLSGADLSGADLTGAVWAPVLSPFEPPTPGFTGANLSGADLTGLFGIDLTGMDLNTTADLTGAICPDGVLADESSCASGFSQIPPPAIAPLFMAPGAVNITVTPYDLDLRYVGTHEFIPGVPSASLSSSIIIGEGSWRGFIGNEAADNHTATTWTFALPDVVDDDLTGLRASTEADSRVGSASDWKTAHEAVERNGGLIFGTQGLLSLQFVVASLAAVASSFVFLSLVLTQRQKELAILQAIGAAPGQIIRLVLFEILSIVLMSMVLGVALGIGLALSFNGFFEVFGFIFQIFQSDGNTLTITRNLVYPWASLALVSASVFGAVVLALLITTRRTLAADLASVLKGE